jgi:membrane protease subunit (stomatin/prohibitin family)
MGIMDFVKGGIRELAIARPDEAKSLVVYKHPDPTIPNRAQLTVEADEVALFFKDGKFIGLLPPGRHKMETDNIPFLGQLVDWGTGGNVWISEVYFVTTRELAGHKFGGKIGKILDPQSRIPIELMVNGTYSFKVVDPTKLVIGLVGLQRTSNEEFLAWFRDQVLKTIKDDIAELCVKKKWPLLDVTSGAYTEEIITEVIQGIRAHVDPYGIEIMGIGNFNLAMSQTDEERLNKIFDNAAYMNMAGGVQGYQQMAAASAMMDAGAAMKNASSMPGGGGNNPLMQGAGLGIGMAMAGQMMHGGQGAPQGVPAGAAAMAGGGAGVSQAQLKTELQQAAQLLREMDIKAALAILDRLVQTL